MGETEMTGFAKPRQRWQVCIKKVCNYRGLAKPVIVFLDGRFCQTTARDDRFCQTTAALTEKDGRFCQTTAFFAILNSVKSMLEKYRFL